MKTTYQTEIYLCVCVCVLTQIGENVKKQPQSHTAEKLIPALKCNFVVYADK